MYRNINTHTYIYSHVANCLIPPLCITAAQIKRKLWNISYVSYKKGKLSQDGFVLNTTVHCHVPEVMHRYLILLLVIIFHTTFLDANQFSLNKEMPKLLY